DAVIHATHGAGTGVVVLRACGSACFEGTATLRPAGTWRFSIDIDSNRGPIHTTETIPLPTPDGTATLQKAFRAMDALTSAANHEELSTSVQSPPVVTDYTYRAPDAFSFSVVGGAQRISIGRDEYNRATPSTPWTQDT